MHSGFDGPPIPFRRGALGAAVLALSCGMPTARGEGSIADVPLFLGNAEMPNVIMGVDDSSSMTAEVVMPYGVNDSYYFATNTYVQASLFPDAYNNPFGLATQGGGSNLYTTGVVPPLPEYADARSPAFNSQYFDPGTDYQPWADYDLVFNPSDPAAARWDPVKSNRPTENIVPNYNNNAACPPPTPDFPNTFPLDSPIKCAGWGYTFYAGTGSTPFRGKGYYLVNGAKTWDAPTLPADTPYFKWSTPNGSVNSGTWVTNPDSLRNPFKLNDPSNSLPPLNKLGVQYYPATFYLPDTLDIRAAYPKYFSSYVHDLEHDAIVKGLDSASPPALQALYWDLDNGGGIDYLDKDTWNLGGQSRTRLKRYEIRCDSAHFSDLNQCASALRNFANWFTYYRSRQLATRGAIGFALEHIKGMNLGIFRINAVIEAPPGVSNIKTPLPSLALKNLSNVGDRNALLTNNDNGVYYYNFTGATPNRQAVKYMGMQFEQADTIQYSCQKNSGILFTDGAYDYKANVTIGVGNVDNSLFKSGDGKNIFSGIDPYKDGASDTLADIAMKYYVGLDSATPGLSPGQVPIPSACAKPGHDPGLDCNNNPHMNFYGVSLGVPGKLFKPDNPKLDPYALTAADWPSTTSAFTIADKEDDFWHATLNGRGRLFSAKNPVDLRDKLGEIINTIAQNSGSASSVATTSVYLSADTLVFMAGFDSGDWSGEVYAFKFADGRLSDPPVWQASAKLTSASYPYRQQHIFSYNPQGTACGGGAVGKAIPFDWEFLNCDQQAQLDSGYDPDQTLPPDKLGPARVEYLKGDTSKEMRHGGPFRDRTDAKGSTERLLGDFVNSNPAFAGGQDFGYDLLPGTEGTAYADYLANDKASRPPMLYIGGNDGMLHAFNATGGAAGGEEVFGYVPSTAYANLNRLSSPAYIQDSSHHKFFVDGSPWVGDAYLGGRWKTLLLGTTGAGGRGVFALDIGHPGGFGTADVLWEFATTDNTRLPDLGYSLPQAVLLRTNDEEHPWVALVANGYYSQNGHAVLFVLDLASGSLLKRFDTLAGGNAWIDKNGLSSPIAIDMNQDRKADYVYAGDLTGNLWKLDFTDPKLENWDFAHHAGGRPAPLFVACVNNGTPCADADRQPITGKPQVGLAQGQLPGFMVYFGTGRYFLQGDNDPTAPIGQQPQTLYGVWDGNSSTGTVPPVAKAKLARQTILGEARLGLYKARFTSSNPVDYATQQGWYLDLIGPGGEVRGERSVSDPVLHDGKITYTTLAPTQQHCAAGGSGWIMELDAFTGGAPAVDAPLFDVNKDGHIDGKDIGNGGAPTGLAFDALPSSTRIVRDGGHIHRITNTSAGVDDEGRASAEVQKGNSADNPGRQSWRQIR
ncbi:pilus assembly protein [Methylomagnum ishizawai]|uniref:pilus assembly protein n=1 Tax=Methylomagnum ishizawai TaxID=1760988 RepID=UPI001C33849B|nr:PilC/PilY family type IV pilus protein [Methylomagnum ishizawai]BBL73093.1 hypothetical protein MishRS11D_01910 [Methylomagnum ishizawai]